MHKLSRLLLKLKYKSRAPSKGLLLLLILMPCITLPLLIKITWFTSNSWQDELISFTTPLWLLINFLLLLTAIFGRLNPWWTAGMLIVNLIPLRSLNRTLSFHFVSGDSPQFIVASFNVATFNTERMNSKQSDADFNLSFFRGLRNPRSPDILCLQEFYHNDSEAYDIMLDSIVEAGQYKYYYFYPAPLPENTGLFGVITFSRYRSVGAGILNFGDHPVNKGIYNDFLIGDDTVRIINFQFPSMSIRWDKHKHSNPIKNLGLNVQDIISRLHAGYEKRLEDLNELLNLLDTSSVATIICADLNSLPYSFTYNEIGKRLENAFEHGGNGFGFTYRNFPWFIRIDNQFYDSGLRLHYFKTHNRFRHSDHIAISAGYSFGKN